MHISLVKKFRPHNLLANKHPWARANVSIARETAAWYDSSNYGNMYEQNVIIEENASVVANE